MDLHIIREHLAQAERHVALIDRHIARQVEIVDELGRNGHPIALALDLLEERTAEAPRAAGST